MPQQLNIFGLSKEDEAIEFIEFYEPDEGWFGGFSGGKDSVVLKDLGDKANTQKPIEWNYSAVGLDPPELVRYIRKYHKDVKFNYPKQSFFKEMQTRGFPTKFTRWCCDFLKKDPTKNNPKKNRLMGIRSEESSSRSKRAQIDKYKNGDNIYKPLFYWKEWEIWDYIESYKLPYCKLYDEGFSRLGCVVCPFICNPKPKKAKWILETHRQRWPKQYAMFEKSMKYLYLHSDLPSMRKLRLNNLWRMSLGYNELVSWEVFIMNWYLGKSNFYVCD